MQSKRRKVQRCRDESPQQMRHAYEHKRPVNRFGPHAMLRWLTIARAYPERPPSDTCPMAAANAWPTVVTTAECREMEQQVASRVMSIDTYPLSHLQFAAGFFQWWYRVAAVAEYTPLPAEIRGDACGWLTPDDLTKSLVVPDIRRCALKVAHMMAIRAGEFELVSAMQGGRIRAVSAALQILRTEEWRMNVHNAIMYGTIDDIYRAGLMGIVQMAVVDSRYQGRISFSWMKEVLRTPSNETHEVVPWPVIFCHGESFIVVWQGKSRVCRWFGSAYATWRDVCLQMGGVVGGRYDVRKCTI